jgi:hypothetical protein
LNVLHRQALIPIVNQDEVVAAAAHFKKIDHKITSLFGASNNKQVLSLNHFGKKIK